MSTKKRAGGFMTLLQRKLNTLAIQGRQVTRLKVERRVEHKMNLARKLAVASAVVLALSVPVKAQDVQTPDDNAQPNPHQVAYGRALFFEPGLSTTGQVSCATCHIPERGYVDTGLSGNGVMVGVSQGVNGQLGTRRAQTVINAVYKRALFHDGRAEFLEGQCTQPLQAPAEMGNQNLNQAFGRIARIPGYQQMALEAFGNTVNVAEGIKAIAAFERTLVSSEAPIDRYAKGEVWVFTERQKHGAQLFYSSGCTNCHTGKNFTDGEFHNILGQTRDRNGNLDTGRGKIVRDNRENFKFVTPMLREVARRAPYGHAGQFADMAAVIRYMGNPVRGQGVEISRQSWSQKDEDDLVAFFMGDGPEHPGAMESYDYPLVTQPSLPR